MTLTFRLLVFVIATWCYPSAVVADGTSIWNDVLWKSCPFEFNPIGAWSMDHLLLDRMHKNSDISHIPPNIRMSLVASWVGDRFDPKTFQEAEFDYESISAWPTNPWTTNIECGAMLHWNPNSIVFDAYTYEDHPIGLGWPLPERGMYHHPNTYYSDWVKPNTVNCEDYLGPVRFIDELSFRFMLGFVVTEAIICHMLGQILFFFVVPPPGLFARDLGLERIDCLRYNKSVEECWERFS